MVFREVFETQDLRRMCKHAERDHEMKRLIALIERVKRQLADRANAPGPSAPKPPGSALPDGVPGSLSRWSVFER